MTTQSGCKPAAERIPWNCLNRARIESPVARMYTAVTGPSDARWELTKAKVNVVARVPTAKVWWYPHTRAAFDYFRWGNELLFAGGAGRRVRAVLPVVRSLLAGRREPWTRCTGRTRGGRR